MISCMPRACGRNLPLIAVALFAGAGGMSLYAFMAGIDVRLAIEIDPRAARTYAYNDATLEGI